MFKCCQVFVWCLSSILTLLCINQALSFNNDLSTFDSASSEIFTDAPEDFKDKPLHILLSNAFESKGKKCTFVDIGSNFGFNTNYAAKLGCKVWGFDPQSGCVSTAENIVQKSNVSHLVTVFNRPVSNQNNISIELYMNEYCAQTFSVLDMTVRNEVEQTDLKESYNVSTLLTIQIDSFFPDNMVVDLMKVDTDGHDVQVLQGADAMLKENRIKNLIVEGCPDMWDVSLAEGENMFKNLFTYGYSVQCVPESPITSTVYTSQNESDFFEFLGSLHCCSSWLVSIV